MLSIVIGIVFVLLLFSLLATTIMEMLAGLLSLRGKNLLNAIQSMLGPKTMLHFTGHEYFKQLSETPNLFRRLRSKRLPPSYIRPGTFTAILMDVLQLNSTGAAREAIDGLPKGELRDVLDFLYKEANEDITVFRKKVEEWFNEVMERASEWYVNNIRIWLIGVGMCIAVLFNVDVIGIYNNLSVNATLREYIADTATQFVNTQAAPSAEIVPANPDFYAAQQKMNTLLSENINAIRSPLGIGWTNVDWSQANAQWWLFKLVGWITTALAISLGAKFWFDLLRMLVSIRGGGNNANAAPAQQIIVTNQPVTAANTTPPAPAPLLARPPESPLESTGARSQKQPSPKPQQKK